MLKNLIKNLLKESLLENNGNTVTMYHVSSKGDLTEPLTGTYSRKFGIYGLYVAPLKAIKDSWTAYAYNKNRGVGQRQSKKSEKEYFAKEQQTYKTMSLYKLEIPKWVFKEIEKRHTEKMEQEFQKSGDGGAWGWDEEYFIPSDLLQHVRINSKQTNKPKEFMSNLRTRKGYNITQKSVTDTDYQKGGMKKYDYSTERFLSLDNILKARDESINLYTTQELNLVISTLNHFLSPGWIQNKIKEYENRDQRWRKTMNRGKPPEKDFNQGLISRRIKEAEQERNINKENAERKLNLAKSKLKS